MSDFEIEKEEEENFDSEILTLESLNIEPTLQGVPIAWSVFVLGGAMLFAVGGFATSNSLIGLLWGSPFMVFFFILKLICAESQDALKITTLYIRGFFRRLFYGSKTYVFTSFDESKNVNNINSISKVVKKLY